MTYTWILYITILSPKTSVQNSGFKKNACFVTPHPNPSLFFYWDKHEENIET